MALERAYAPPHAQPFGFSMREGRKCGLFFDNTEHMKDVSFPKERKFRLPDQHWLEAIVLSYFV